MTKREMYNLIATVNSDNKEIVDFCMHEIELLDAKKGASRKQTPKQKQNEVFKGVILETLTVADKPMTVGEIIEVADFGEPLSTSKVTSLLTLLKKDNKVSNHKEGKKSVYTLPLDNETDVDAE